MQVEYVKEFSCGRQKRIGRNKNSSFCK